MGYGYEVWSMRYGYVVRRAPWLQTRLAITTFGPAFTPNTLSHSSTRALTSECIVYENTDWNGSYFKLGTSCHTRVEWIVSKAIPFRPNPTSPNSPKTLVCASLALPIFGSLTTMKSPSPSPDPTPPLPSQPNPSHYISSSPRIPNTTDCLNLCYSLPQLRVACVLLEGTCHIACNHQMVAM